MRYRPFGAGGGTVSDLTLSLGMDAVSRGPDAAAALIYSALESGVNSYRLETADPVLAEIVGHALGSVDRNLLNVSLTLGRRDGRRREERDFTAEGMTYAIDRVLNLSRLKYVDIAVLDAPGEDELPQSSLIALKALRATDRVKRLGISGQDPVTDTYVSTGAFDVLVTPFHVDSPWQVRSRVRAARLQDMAIMAEDYFPDSLDTARKAQTAHAARKSSLFGWLGGGKRAHPLEGAGGFGFLHRTPNWSAEEICLAHVLSDPAIASVLVSPRSPEALAALAAVPERDMPPGLTAQIEMARVSMAGRSAA